MITPKFTEEVAGFIERYYFPNLIRGLQSISTDVLDSLSKLIIDAIQSGKHIFAFGNGGSEAIAEHFVYSLEGKISENYKFDTYSNPRLSESTDTSNSELFNYRVRRSGKAGDLAFLISASGNSENISNVSLVCKEEEVTTVSLSQYGKVARTDSKTKSDYSIVIDSQDQQIVEDITQIILHILTELVQYQLERKKYEVEDVKRDYITKISEGSTQIKANYLQKITQAVICAYKSGKSVRIDAPDNGALSISAGHTMHNFKWDVFSNVIHRTTNKTYSGIPAYHLTGVGNDGGDSYNHVVEVSDNSEEGDVEIIFCKSLESPRTKSLMQVAQNKKIVTYPLRFELGDDYAEADLAQIAGHIMGRILNTYLLLEEGTITESGFGNQLLSDLALLRQKQETYNYLKSRYGG